MNLVLSVSHSCPARTLPGLSYAVSESPLPQTGWLFGIRPLVLDQLVPQGIPEAEALSRLREEARRLGYDSLRLLSAAENADLFRDSMREATPEGAVPAAFECPLTPDCPLLPLRMHPAFRGGSLTPWGGEKLRTVYGKPLLEVPTGESLEASCVPELNSTDDAGTPLQTLKDRYGRSFCGFYHDQAFPLLLKLIDARDRLSVQVHPDDAYARSHENGKLGKTEAWLILDAPEGSELVYGIREGVTMEELRRACEKGAAVEPLLRKVKVRPGDVCYIPAGCVHAIGSGILLYEIQQSSDITYRFYDWDRTDSQGRRRALHLAQALDVTDLSLQPSPIHAPEGVCVRVLNETYFTLDLLHPADSLEMPEIRDFGFLTGLEGTLEVCFACQSMNLAAGETLYIPASAPALTLRGQGRAALSMPRHA